MNKNEKYILVVDDNKDYLGLISDVLNSEGYNVIQKENGICAINYMHEHIPDLVLLDIRLPGMNGLKVLEKMKKITRELTIIIITAYGDIDNRKTAMKLGAYDYITKPFDYNELINNINSIFKN